MLKRSKKLILPRRQPHIGIDLLGSDVNESSLLDSALAGLSALGKSCDATFFLQDSSLLPRIPERYRSIVVSQSVTMDESAVAALRTKKDSSMAVGMRMLKEKKIDAFVSCGSSGALLAFAATMLSKIKGIQRPALLALVPTKDRMVAVVDVGASVAFKGSFFVQYAKMGVAYQKCLGIASPKVALLNIGSEASKGSIDHQKGYKMLTELKGSQGEPLFTGNIEPRQVFTQEIDVLATDGFSGNIFLKTAEGAASLLLEKLTELSASISGLKEQLLLFKKRFDYTEHPGALLCGVDGIVMKCHGSGHSASFALTIEKAFHLADKNFLQLLTKELAS